MKRVNIVLILSLLVIILSSGLVNAMYQAEINQGEKSLAYSVQGLSQGVNALSLEGDITLTETIGLLGLYNVSDGNQFLNLGLKLKVIDDIDLDISILGNYYLPMDRSKAAYPGVGLLISNPLSKYFDLNVGFNFLLGKPQDYLGIEFGFDYMLSRNWYIEGGFRRFVANGSNEGLNIGIRNYF